jgi:hypothetical protein
LPRSIGRRVYAANADEGYSDQPNTDLIAPFRIDPASGRLTPTGQVVKTESPCTIVFAGAQPSDRHRERSEDTMGVDSGRL